MKTAEFNRL